MHIQYDTREKPSQLKRILPQLDALEVDHFPSKLYVGDYVSLDNSRLVIDRKKDLQELCGNVTQQHERFRNELIRAQEKGIKLIILCEHGGNIKTLTDVPKWYNPRLKVSPRALTGKQLYAILKTMMEKYDFDIVFCQKSETGRRIVELLS